MFGQLKKSRPFSFLIIIIVYLLAAVIGTAVYLALPENDLLVRLFISDLAATVWIYVMSLLAQNSSVYDPYWSVAPLVMLPLTAWQLGAWHHGTLLLMMVLLFWGIRLTFNWALSFSSLENQDWRYTSLHDNHPRFWPVINLLGIHIFPTLVVFLAMIPAFIFIRDFQQLNPGIMAGALLSLLATALQAIADSQMRRFRRNPENNRQVNRHGLWRFSRHPNYLGEILMWWRIFVMMVSARPVLWLAMLGPVLNTLMFILISIPMMERRQVAAKPEYIQYMAETGMLLPRFRRILR